LLLRRTQIDVDGDLLSHVRRDDVDFVRANVRKAAVNDQLEGNVFNPCVILHAQPTLPMYAAAYGATRCFQYLWELGAGARDRDVKYTTLSDFAIAGNSMCIVEFLLQNRVACCGAKQVAAAFHRNSLFRAITAMRKSAQLGEEDLDGRLPIIAAAAANNVELLGFLLGDGADVNRAEGFGMTALHAAAKAGHTQAVCLLLRVESVNPNAADIWGTTPLHLAVDCNQVRVVEAMARKKKVDVNAKDGNGRTALYIAARAGKVKIVRLLLQRQDLAVNECNRKGVCFAFSIHHFTQRLSPEIQRLCWQCQSAPPLNQRLETMRGRRRPILHSSSDKSR
jgi:ankyrin repeat protein